MKHINVYIKQGESKYNISGIERSWDSNTDDINVLNTVLQIYKTSGGIKENLKNPDLPDNDSFAYTFGFNFGG